MGLYADALKGATSRKPSTGYAGNNGARYPNSAASRKKLNQFAPEFLAVTPPAGRVLLAPSSGQQLTLVFRDDAQHDIIGDEYTPIPQGDTVASHDSGATDLEQVTLGLTIDCDKVDGPDMDRRLEVLVAMGTKDDEGVKPYIVVYSSGLPGVTGSWVMRGLSSGAHVERLGSVRRLDVDIVLARQQPLAELEEVRLRPSRTKKGKRRSRYIQSRPNDTMRSIAVRQLGSAGEWKSVREWNKKTLKDVHPDDRLKTGTRIELR